MDDYNFVMYSLGTFLTGLASGMFLMSYFFKKMLHDINNILTEQDQNAKSVQK